MKKLFVALMLMPQMASAGEVSVMGVTARQRYPWNGLVDIAVTFSGTSNDVGETICTFAATNGVQNAALSIKKIRRNGYDFGSGFIWTRRFVWDAAADVGAMKIDDVVLTVEAKLPCVQLWKDGPYWAECNVGALVPEACGYYFWWGSTVGYWRNGSSWDASRGTRTGFSFCKENCLTYGMDLFRLDALYISSNPSILLSARDAATAYLGAPWRMPTGAELLELVNNCNNEWTIRNGVCGMLVSGRGIYASKSIFLPAAGYGNSTRLDGLDSIGFYWSSSPSLSTYFSTYTYYLRFHSSGLERDLSDRVSGMPIRPLRNVVDDLPEIATATVTTCLSLDCRKGMRTISSKGEALCYDADWYDGGSLIRLADNGECIASGSSGTVHWTPVGNQIHRLSMSVVSEENVEIEKEVAYFACVQTDGAVAIPDGWTEIPSELFQKCDWVTSVILPSSVASIGWKAFADCANITSVSVPARVNVASVFSGSRTKIREVSIVGTGMVPASAYADCTALTRINVASMEDWLSLSFANTEANPLSTGAALYVGGEEITELVIPEGTTEIGDFAFQGGQFTSVTIPNSVTNIAATAFAGCRGLTSVVLPGRFEMPSVFPDSYKTITTFVIADGSTCVCDSAFSGCSGLTSVTIPPSVTSVGRGAFAGCSGLSSVVFPSNLLVTCSSLREWGLSEEVVKRISGDYVVGDFVIINSTLLAYVGPADVKEVEIPDGVAIIDERAFAELGMLEKVTMPASVRRIEAAAFAMDARLTSIVLPEGLGFIGDEAFYGCTKMANVIVPGSVKSVGRRAFRQCTALTNAQLAYGVESIGDECFYSDWRISEVDLPSTVTNIGKEAFGGDSSIIRAGLRCDVRKISEIFSNYQHIREIIVKEGDGEIVDGCFKDCEELKDVRYMGNCPALEKEGRELYANTFVSNTLTLVSYVLPESTGWDGIESSDQLPQAWPLVGGYRRPIAHWDVPTYLCRFDSNGGTLGVQDTYQYSEQDVVLPPEPVQSGYKFAGWWTQPVGGLRVTERTIFIEGVYTYLWAHWVKGHTVFLDPNGGVVINGFVTYVDESVYGVLPTPVRSGYAFDGWLYNNEKVRPDTKINEMADHTLTAQWTANQYKVQYHPNGGTGDLVVEEWVYGETNCLRRNAFVREGYVFIGWATEEGSDEVVYRDCEPVANLTTEDGAIVELWAVWQESDAVDPTNVDLSFGGEANWEKVYELVSTQMEGHVVCTPSFWRSGKIADNEQSDVRTEVFGAGTIGFWWKVSCEKFRQKKLDHLSFAIDGIEQTWINGETDWTYIEFRVDEVSAHEFVWRYEKDEMDSDGDDCGSVCAVVWAPRLETLEDYAGTTNLTLVTSGDAEWCGVTDVTHNQSGSVRSGKIADGQESRLGATVEGEGVVEFWWKTDCERFRDYKIDRVAFYVDGSELAWTNGVTDWQHQRFKVSGAGMHTLSWVYIKDDEGTAGEDCAWVSEINWIPAGVAVPSVIDDDNATVTGDAETGFIVKPSEGKTSVEVTIPQGVDAAKVTVEVSTKVASVKPNGAKVKIVNAGADITEFLNMPAVDGNGIVDLTKATVKEEIVKETMDVEKGAEIELNVADPKLTTAPTRAGLFYRLREGETLGGMKDGASKVGDGKPWSPEIKVKGGNSAFYSIGVGKGE